MPATSSSTAVSLATVDPTWRIALRVWWSWQWRAFIATILLTWFVQFWVNIIGGMIGSAISVVDATVIKAFSITATYFVSGIVALYFMKDVLDRDFGKFRVCV